MESAAASRGGASDAFSQVHRASGKVRRFGNSRESQDSFPRPGGRKVRREVGIGGTGSAPSSPAGGGGRWADGTVSR